MRIYGSMRFKFPDEVPIEPFATCSSNHQDLETIKAAYAQAGAGLAIDHTPISAERWFEVEEARKEAVAAQHEVTEKRKVAERLWARYTKLYYEAAHRYSK